MASDYSGILVKEGLEALAKAIIYAVRLYCWHQTPDRYEEPSL